MRKFFLDEIEMVGEAPRKRPCEGVETLECLNPVRRKLDFDQAIFDTP